MIADNQQDLGVGDPAPSYKRITETDLRGYREVAHDLIRSESKSLSKVGLLISRLCDEVEELNCDRTVAILNKESAETALRNLRRKQNG